MLCKRLEDNIYKRESQRTSSVTYREALISYSRGTDRVEQQTEDPIKS